MTFSNMEQGALMARVTAHAIRLLVVNYYHICGTIRLCLICVPKRVSAF